MKKYFYSHIVEIESISQSLDSLNISEKEKEHLVSLAEENVHFTVIDSALNNLSPDDKKIFLSKLNKDSHEEIWKFLKEKVENIETILKIASENVLDSFKNDIGELKEKAS